MEVTVVLATHGDDRWRTLAAGDAFRSALEAGASSVVMHHEATPGATVARARNEASSRVQTEWLCFLDADDQLEPGYFDAMSAVDRPGRTLRAPAVRFVPAGAPLDECPAATLADRDIARLNPCVIGTVVRTAEFREVGGFWEWPAWEDWCLFRRLWYAGAAVVHVPDAVYRVNVNPLGRNAVPPDVAPRLHRQIRTAHARWNRSRRIR